MKTIDYYILDVFAKEKHGGNQLAVYLDPDDILDTDQMLKIAKEINFAESTFIKKKIDENKYEVRIFTTESEIPFAGHPTIGTSYVIAKHLLPEPTEEIILSLKNSEINVSLSNASELDNCLFTMTQSQPAFLKKFSKEQLVSQLDIDPSLIVDQQAIQEISTGLPFIIIPIKDLKRIEKIRLKPGNIKDFLITNKIYKTNSVSEISTSFLFFTNETYESGNDYNVRMFCLEDDILKEDAATGSANGCFLAYLLKYHAQNIKARIEQGFQMGRKSYLYLDGSLNENEYTIQVSGHSKDISFGKWII